MTRGPGPLRCEDCGGHVIVGLEPVSPGEDDLEPGQTQQRVDFCTNPDCSSNHLRGLNRVGVNHYICTVCRAELSGPIQTVFGHRQTH
jgi:hypothetical protein